MRLTSPVIYLLIALAGISPANILLASNAVAQPSAAMLPNQVAAVSSLVTESCTATAGNPVLACGATGDFAVGQPTFAPLAAAPNTLNAGNGAGVGPTISAINYVRLPGGAGAKSGSSTYCYAITTFDGRLAESAPGPTRCTGATEPSRLGGNQSEQPVWPIVPGATQYGIYGCSGSGCTPHQIGTSLQMTGLTVSSVLSTGWEDFGLPASTRTAPGTALNGVLYATVIGITPNVSITVSNPPAISGSLSIAHENCGPINTTLTSYSPLGGTLSLVSGPYSCARLLDIPDETTLAGQGCSYTQYPQSNGNSPGYNHGPSIIWGGPDGVITAREWTGENEHSDCINYNANTVNLTATASAAITQMVVDADDLPPPAPGGKLGGNNFARVQGGFYGGYVECGPAATSRSTAHFRKPMSATLPSRTWCFIAQAQAMRWRYCRLRAAGRTRSITQLSWGVPKA